MTEFGANRFSERCMSLRLVKGSGSTPAAPKETGATAFLLIDPRGGVRAALGWESVSVDPVPGSLAATDAGDPILDAIVLCAEETRRTRQPAARSIEVSLEKPHLYA